MDSDYSVGSSPALHHPETVCIRPKSLPMTGYVHDSSPMQFLCSGEHDRVASDATMEVGCTDASKFFDDCLVNTDSPQPADLLNVDASTSSQWSNIQSDSFIGNNSSAAAGSNTTENVRVNSSFHVAEIVGKQGVKIKRIRAGTNTWIKTPARGQDPVFIISGRREGVEQAKFEILASNERVSKIRELRGRNVKGEQQVDDPPDLSTEEHCIIENVSVPTHAVGFVIGPKGSRVREIADATCTYIKTPCRYREPIFEICGHPSDVKLAREKILALIQSKDDSGYIRQCMAKMPIHERGTPVIPRALIPQRSPSGTHCSVPTTKSAVTDQEDVITNQADVQQDVDVPCLNNFTRIRPFSPCLMPPIVSALSKGNPNIFNDLLSCPSQLSSTLATIPDPCGSHRSGSPTRVYLSGQTNPPQNIEKVGSGRNSPKSTWSSRGLPAINPRYSHF
ncbi:uncharacterized protein [Watersipora subatra]|uniref:uncharacterized protein n=1 Tax=Watersipora subatra TaxID=2589382 RepID=UPI00355B73A5